MSATTVATGVVDSLDDLPQLQPDEQEDRPSRRNLTIRQNASICSRDAADISVGTGGPARAR